jgi:hypothetical protein
MEDTRERASVIPGINSHKSSDILYAVLDACGWSIIEDELLEFAKTLEDKNKRLNTSDISKILKQFGHKAKPLTILTYTKEKEAKIKSRIRETDFAAKYAVDGRSFIVSNGRRTWAIVSGVDIGKSRNRLSFIVEVLKEDS